MIQNNYKTFYDCGNNSARIAVLLNSLAVKGLREISNLALVSHKVS
jgi:hypothetical protein